jgi:hypothetical protein
MAGMTCNGHATGFGRMFILPVTSFRDYQIPAIGFDKFYNITNFHVKILAYISGFDDVLT